MSSRSFVDRVVGKRPRRSDLDGGTGTMAEVLHDTRTFIHRYVRLSDEQTTLVAVWVAMTHALDAFDYAAYLHITSPLPECGKTRLLEVLESLVAKPWFTGRVSAAVLMRKIDKEHPTLLLDESDAAFNGDEQYCEALRGVLNVGYQRNGCQSVCVGQGAALQSRDFSVFGPKAIAGIGRLPATVESRSIPIVMKRRLQDVEIVHKWRHRRGWENAAPLRERLAALMAARVETLRLAADADPLGADGLSDRAEDVLTPLFAIADAAGAEWPTSVRHAAVVLMGRTRAIREADQHLPLELLADLREVFNAHPNEDALATKVLIEALAAIEDGPWSAFGRSEKPITAYKLSLLLKKLNILPAGPVWMGGKVVRSYRRVVFEEAFDRYLARDSGSQALGGKTVNESGSETAKT